MVENNKYDPGESKSRIRLILCFVIVLGLVSIGRLFYLQVMKHDYYVAIAATQHWAVDRIPADRGTIFVKDRVTNELYPLAGNQTLNFVAATPIEVENKGEAAKRLAPVINLEEAKILELLERNHTYVVLKHGLSFEASEKVESFNIKGIHTAEEGVRYYPEGILASQLLGFVNDEGVGNYGLEQQFDKILSGTPGLYNAEIDPSGKKIVFGDDVSREPVNGSNLVLTINRDVQKKAEELLAIQVQKFKAEGGSIIVMNPETGEILAMANNPTYDPSKFQEVTDYRLFKNASVQNLYEPGSIFKVITMAIGLDTDAVEPDTKYEDKGQLVLDGHKIMNSDRKTNGWQTMTQVLEKSLNTGTTFVMQLVGKNKFYQYLVDRFSFGKKTGIEQPNEAEGSVPTPEEVNDHTYATVSFGQSLSATPIQMISTFAAVANGGKLIQPHLVAEINSPEGGKTVTDTRPLKEIISEEAAAQVRQMMVSVVQNGHGKQAGVKGYNIGGKTGTAQVPLANGKGYDPSRNIGSFIGFGPAENPHFVVLAKIDSPKGVAWAESTAAPVVGQMFDYLFKYYQIAPTN
jgi:cell division protein FtsI/penicillin-binding protein 2